MILLLVGNVQAAITDDLLGFWDFDEGAGTLAEDSLGIHNGTAVNSPVIVPGILGNARQFHRASSQYFSFTDDAHFNTGNHATYLFWVNKTEDNNVYDAHTVMSNEDSSAPFDGFALQVSTQAASNLGFTRFYYINAGQAYDINQPWASPRFDDGEYHMITYVYDAGELYRYFDGQLTNQTTENDVSILGGGQFTIGSRNHVDQFITQIYIGSFKGIGHHCTKST